MKVVARESRHSFSRFCLEVSQKVLIFAHENCV